MFMHSLIKIMIRCDPPVNDKPEDAITFRFSSDDINFERGFWENVVNSRGAHLVRRHRYLGSHRVTKEEKFENVNQFVRNF